jgi:signal transduction histidine kinase
VPLGQEAVVNARRHARAASIVVSVDYGDRRLALSVRDDGCGIDDAVLAAGRRDGHWGLTGMQERAQRLGGELRVQRHPDGGTEVSLTVPARRVYADRAPDGWRRRLAALWR